MLVAGVGMAVIRMHVTEQASLRQRLEEERDTLRVVMEATNAHIAYLDRDFNFVMVNSTYVRACGHSAEELIGRNHFYFFPNEENEAIFRKVRDTGEPVEYKAKPFEYADQPWRGVTYWDWVLTPVKDSSGRVQGLVLSLVDVTDTIHSKQMSDALNSINAAVNSTLDFDELMQRVVSESAQAIGSESARIALREADRWVVKYVYRFPEKFIGASLADEEVLHLTLALKTRRPVAIDDAFTDARVKREVMEAYGLRSVLVVPLTLKEDVIGMLSFNYHSGPVAFTESQIDFANKLAASVSLAMQNAGLFADLEHQLDERLEAQEALEEAYERERRIATTLQQALAPGEPTIPGPYKVAALYVPAFAGEQVGGDFYDVFQTEDGKIGVVIGDVSGKGIAAAAVSAATRSVIRAFTYELSAPGESLTHANAVLCGQQSEFAYFVTVFLAVIDLSSGFIRYSSAGHPPTAVVRAGGAVEFLTFGQTPIGVFDQMLYGEAEAQLAAGDKLVFYTDGVSEARRNSRLFGVDGIKRILRKHGHKAVKDLAGEVLAAASAWARGRLSDDTAVIVIERGE
jgi:PAS domain S-box-containing protein